MKKQAKDLQKGEKIKLADRVFSISEVELSDIGKHGKRKVRLVLQQDSEEKMVIVRPEDYPIETI